jgi:hypothetical protein
MNYAGLIFSVTSLLVLAMSDSSHHGLLTSISKLLVFIQAAIEVGHLETNSYSTTLRWSRLILFIMMIVYFVSEINRS